MSLFSHTGDIGDIIACLPAVRQLGGGDFTICERVKRLEEGGGRESMKGARFEAIKPLMEAQPYIKEVRWSDARPVATHDFINFRDAYRNGTSLAQAQASYLGIEKLDVSPWLTALVNPEFRGRSVFARSPRYHNGFYPWFALLKRYLDAVFVGTEDEHRAFQQEFSCQLPFAKTSNLLELASIIAGARIFCGNQSCPWWIAAGLGVPTFQETWAFDQNSIIERHNAFYMTGNTFDLSLLPA